MKYVPWLTVFEKKTRLALVCLKGYIQELQWKWMVWCKVWRVAEWRKNSCLCWLFITKAPGCPNSCSTWSFIVYVVAFMPLKLLLFPCLRHICSLNFPSPDPVGCHIHMKEKINTEFYSSTIMLKSKAMCMEFFLFEGTNVICK